MIQTITELKAWFRNSKSHNPEFFVSAKLRRAWILEHETFVMRGRIWNLEFTNFGGGIWLAQLVEPSKPTEPVEMKYGWQPIATAPKDGTGVLLCRAYDADGKPINWERDPELAGVHVQVAMWWETKWVVFCSLPTDPLLHFEPTHWQPVPPPPNLEKA